jgi:hypothetical protein
MIKEGYYKSSKGDNVVIGVNFYSEVCFGKSGWHCRVFKPSKFTGKFPKYPKWYIYTEWQLSDLLGDFISESFDERSLPR